MYNDVSGEEGNNSCLYYFPKASTLAEAQSVCMEIGHGSHLVTVNSDRWMGLVSATGADILSVMYSMIPASAGDIGVGESTPSWRLGSTASPGPWCDDKLG